MVAPVAGMTATATSRVPCTVRGVQGVMNTTLLALLPEIIVTDHDTCGEVLGKGECYDDAEDVDIRGPFAHVVSLVGTWEDEGDRLTKLR